MRAPRLESTFVNCALVALVVAACGSPALSQSLYELPPDVQTRWASPENPTGAKGAAGRTAGGRKGSPTISVPAGERRVLAEVTQSSGVVRRIWMTFGDRSPRMLRSLKLEMYWDGSPTPAVSAPVGDFFGVGLGRTASFQSSLFASPEGRSFVCMIPMPFRTGMRIVVTNESAANIPELFYDVDYTVGDALGATTLYLHTYFNRENPTKLQQDYEIVPRVEGAGRYLGANVGVIVDSKTYDGSWWGEGEVKIYIDGDRELPTLAGTGTEDYIGTGWGEGSFAHAFSGCTVADDKIGQWSFYRYHVPDPIYFRKDIRVTMQQIGYAGQENREAFRASGHPIFAAGPGRTPMDLSHDGKFERSDDWSSCAYFYLDKPEGSTQPLMPVAKRIEGL